MKFLIGRKYLMKIGEEDHSVINLFKTKFSDLGEGIPVIRVTPKGKIPFGNRVILSEIGIEDYCSWNGEKFVATVENKHVSLPFESIGTDTTMDIEYELGMNPIALMSIVEGLFAYWLLQKGESLLHAAGVVKNGVATLFPAWRAGGKTIVTLSLLKEGYGYLGEDFVIVSSEGLASLYSDAIHLDLNHLKIFPEIRTSLKMSKIRYIMNASIYYHVLPRIPHKGLIGRGCRYLFLNYLRKKDFTRIQDVMANPQICNQNHSIKAVFLLTKRASRNHGVLVSEITLSELAERVVKGMNYERDDVLKLYKAYVFATGRRNQILENCEDIEKNILEGAFRHAEIKEISVPSKWMWSDVGYKIQKIIAQTIDKTHL